MHLSSESVALANIVVNVGMVSVNLMIVIMMYLGLKNSKAEYEGKEKSLLF